MHNNRKSGILNSERDEAGRDESREHGKSGSTRRTHETYFSGKPNTVGVTSLDKRVFSATG